MCKVIIEVVESIVASGRLVQRRGVGRSSHCVEYVCLQDDYRNDLPTRRFGEGVWKLYGATEERDLRTVEGDLDICTRGGQLAVPPCSPTSGRSGTGMLDGGSTYLVSFGLSPG